MRGILAIVTQIKYNDSSFLFDGANYEIEIDLEARILHSYEKLRTVLKLKYTINEGLMLAMCKKLLPFFYYDMHGDRLLDTHGHPVYLQ